MSHPHRCRCDGITPTQDLAIQSTRKVARRRSGVQATTALTSSLGSGSCHSATKLKTTHTFTSRVLDPPSGTYR